MKVSGGAYAKLEDTPLNSLLIADKMKWLTLFSNLGKNTEEISSHIEFDKGQPILVVKGTLKIPTDSSLTIEGSINLKSKTLTSGSMTLVTPFGQKEHIDNNPNFNKTAGAFDSSSFFSSRAGEKDQILTDEFNVMPKFANDNYAPEPDTDGEAFTANGSKIITELSDLAAAI